MNRTRPYLNKFVLQKELEITDSYHLQNMKEMKPITSRLMEHTESVIINHTKAEKIREVREIQIARENQALLSRMSSVYHKDGSYSVAKMKNFRTKVNKSLNQIYRKKQEENIALENQRYQARLLSKKPTLNLEKIDRDWKNNKRVMKRMSNCQFYLTTFRPKDDPNKSWLGSSIQIKHKAQPFKMSRVMTIDGHKMEIKIEFVNGSLKIIGALLNNGKKAHIIQIPKREASDFLREDCQGKVQNILPLLRYDRKKEMLFIISNCEEESNESEKEANPEIKIQIAETKDKVNTQVKVETKRQQEIKAAAAEQRTVNMQKPAQIKQVQIVETHNAPQQKIKDQLKQKPKQTRNLPQNDPQAIKTEHNGIVSQQNEMAFIHEQKKNDQLKVNQPEKPLSEKPLQQKIHQENGHQEKVPQEKPLQKAAEEPIEQIVAQEPKQQLAEAKKQVESGQVA